MKKYSVPLVNVAATVVVSTVPNDWQEFNTVVVTSVNVPEQPPDEVYTPNQPLSAALAAGMVNLKLCTPVDVGV
jgi:flagellar basal body rod protein FlgC